MSALKLYVEFNAKLIFLKTHFIYLNHVVRTAIRIFYINLDNCVLLYSMLCKMNFYGECA
jgi:hypothetical protein